MSSNAGSRSSSPVTPRSNQSAELTPRRKVQALLAQFSDSDSDNTPSAGTTLLAGLQQTGSTKSNTALHSNDSSEEEEDEDILPRGRAATRLLGRAATSTRDLNESTDEVAPVNLSEDSPAKLQATAQSLSEENEDIPRPQHRFLVHKRSSPARSIGSRHGSNARSASPMFFPSPGSASGSPVSLNGGHNQNPPSATKTQGGRSKFLALVEKHRKERLAKEAEDVAKRAMGLYEDEPETPMRRGPRGSSPADDSEDEQGSDDGAAQRISKQARPTRKASKKAIEEMNRETQRMSRNMQLAHQAKTKKKITKESLLARFNFVTNDNETTRPAEAHSTTSSSVPGSDSENAHCHNTPPTSPLRGPDSLSKEKPSRAVESPYKMIGAIGNNEDFEDFPAPLLLGSSALGLNKVQEYIRNNRTVLSPELQQADVHVKLASIPETLKQLDTKSIHRYKTTRPNLKAISLSDSDSEIEIVKDKGLRRKYAAFETLPKRKAQEKPSHLALRSLAHLMSHDSSKSLTNGAQMEAVLRRKARMQAIEERKQRIEELKAKGIIIQTAEERERDQQEVEDLVERARQGAAEIQKREKELAKKDGTYVKDGLDDGEDDSDDADFEDDVDEDENDEASGSEEESHDDDDSIPREEGLVDDEVVEGNSDKEDGESEVAEDASDLDIQMQQVISRPVKTMRQVRIVSDDEDEDGEAVDKEYQSPALLPAMGTPHSVPRSARKIIPGLQMSDDLPMGLSQAFAATMADSQDDEVDIGGGNVPSFDIVADVPSPKIVPLAPLQRSDSFDIITDSQPTTQTQSDHTRTNFFQVQAVPESPARGIGIVGHNFTPSQRQFELTQDGGYMLSPFAGSRFAETPSKNVPQSTVDTVVLPAGIETSPVTSRKGRLRRGRVIDDDEETGEALIETAYQVMKQAASRKATQVTFDKSKSNARQHFDEAAEESEDEYAGLGGASDDDADEEENEEDRRMIDEDTQVGAGDEARLAGFYADRERKQDEKDVSKLLKDITTGALRRKRGAGDDLDLSDEEDAVARRREAKRREFARMRRELLKDEAVGKIAEDKKKEAFLRSIEDHDEMEDNDDDEDLPESAAQDEGDSQSQSVTSNVVVADSQESSHDSSTTAPLHTASGSKINRLRLSLHRTQINLNRKPSNLAEIRESVSFLVEEPESQSAMVDLGLSDSEDEPEAYVNLDRHLREAEHDENIIDDEADDLSDFIVADDKDDVEFKKPELPFKERAPFWQRRTKHENVIDRLNLIRQASSSSSSSSASASGKMAFYTNSTSVKKVPELLRRATTNSSLGLTSRENVSATGVSTSNGIERGNTTEKEFIRKGSTDRRNAVNFQARTNLKEEKMSQRAGIVKASKKKANGFLNGLFRGDSWD